MAVLTQQRRYTSRNTFRDRKHAIRLDTRHGGKPDTVHRVLRSLPDLRSLLLKRPRVVWRHTEHVDPVTPVPLDRLLISCDRAEIGFEILRPDLRALVDLRLDVPV